MTSIQSIKCRLTEQSPEYLVNLCGPFNEHLKLLEQRLGIEIRNRGYEFQFIGIAEKLNPAVQLLQKLYDDACHGIRLSPEHIHLLIQQSGIIQSEPKLTSLQTEVSIRTRRTMIHPRGDNQKRYVQSIQQQDINFGIGPAGTGKTYLAVACAVSALEQDEIERILLVRPAVEAGERLGFLPGDLHQKIDPYLRPLYDALYEMIGFETVSRLIERHIIEVAPLAYMRGRTLNNAFVILDESQNSTPEQMKMFLTRIGFGSTAVITGDITQIDLPKGTGSGLVHATKVLTGVKGIGFTQFYAKDVVRHTLVQKIVQAYDSFENNTPSS